MERIEELINNVINGQDPNSELEGILENVNPLQIRKQLRSRAPNLYKYLSDSGYLHEFALDLHNVVADKLIKKYDIPPTLVRELDKFV